MLGDERTRAHQYRIVAFFIINDDPRRKRIYAVVTTQAKQTSDETLSKGLSGIVRQIMTLAEVYRFMNIYSVPA